MWQVFFFFPFPFFWPNGTHSLRALEGCVPEGIYDSHQRQLKFELVSTLDFSVPLWPVSALWSTSATQRCGSVCQNLPQTKKKKKNMTLLSMFCIETSYVCLYGRDNLSKGVSSSTFIPPYTSWAQLGKVHPQQTWQFQTLGFCL